MQTIMALLTVTTVVLEQVYLLWSHTIIYFKKDKFNLSFFRCLFRIVLSSYIVVFHEMNKRVHKQQSRF